MKKNAIMNVTKVVTKIIEVFNWVGATLLLCASICSVVKPEYVRYFLSLDVIEGYGCTLNTYGFEVIAPMVDGQLSLSSFIPFSIGAIILMCLMAMIFRNMNLIIKRSLKESPFCKDNIRMVREIGIFSIAMPVVGLIMSTIIGLIAGRDNVETSVNIFGVFMGIIMLCLTQFFIHGRELENDVEGLV